MADNCPTERELHNHAYCPLKVETWTAFTIPPGPTLTGPRFIRLPYPFLSPFPSCSVRGTIYSDVISQKRTTGDNENANSGSSPTSDHLCRSLKSPDASLSWSSGVMQTLAPSFSLLQFSSFHLLCGQQFLWDQQSFPKSACDERPFHCCEQ